MVKKQFIAQIGVFLLLGLNVAAYYFLWPNYHSVSSNEGKAPTQEKGTTRLVPDAPAPAAPPKELAPSLLKDAVPLSIPFSAPPAGPPSAPVQETINKLSDQIKKDNVAPLPLVTLPLDPPLASAPPQKQGSTPPTASYHPYGDPAPVAIASALTPKMSPSPWLLNMEMVGTRTQLLAKLRQPGTMNVVAEFKIVCDRVEMKAPGGELQALGKVTVAGAGLNASCLRLILPIHETRLVFEEKAEIAHDKALGSLLRGDRIVWELPGSIAPNPVAPPGELRPAGLLPPALGLPN